MDVKKISFLTGAVIASLIFSTPGVAQPMIDFSSWNTLAQNLTYCLSGSFSVPDPAQLASIQQKLTSMSGSDLQTESATLIEQSKLTYTIQGWQGNVCRVVISQATSMPAIPGTNIPPTPANNSTDDSTAVTTYQNPLAANASPATDTSGMNSPPLPSAPTAPPTIMKKTQCNFSQANLESLAKAAQLIGAGGYTPEIATSISIVLSNSCTPLAPSASLKRRKFA